MIDNFKLLLNLLDIEETDEYILLAKKIESMEYENFKIYHKHGFIFQGFFDLIVGKISIEKFVQIGDVYSDFDIKKNVFDLSLLNDYKKLSKTLIVFSKINFGWKYNSKEFDDIKNNLKAINSDIVLI